MATGEVAHIGKVAPAEEVTPVGGPLVREGRCVVDNSVRWIEELVSSGQGAALGHMPRWRRASPGGGGLDPATQRSGNMPRASTVVGKESGGHSVRTRGGKQVYRNWVVHPGTTGMGRGGRIWVANKFVGSSR
jgi:hypothetical protein